VATPVFWTGDFDRQISRFSERYFVLGFYGDEERPRLEAVRDQLASKAASTGGDDDVDAFLMDEIHDISEYFTSNSPLHGFEVSSVVLYFSNAHRK